MVCSLPARMSGVLRIVWLDSNRLTAALNRMFKEAKLTGDLMTGEPIRPSVRESGAGMLWYPLAEAVTPLMQTRGKYANHYPLGAIVHYTAGQDQSEDDARGTLSWGRQQGYCFFVIGPTGKVYQSFPLDEWGYHAGESQWPALGSSVSSKLVGIEVCCAGLLDRHRKSWFGKTYPEKDTRLVTEEQYGCPAGLYRVYTDAQETSLIRLLLWLKANKPNVFDNRYVLGHHEVSGEAGLGYWRKQDPGGALSMSMQQLRQRLERGG